MTTYRQGDIVVVPFPFTNLSQRKQRPALVISNDTVNATGDYLLAQVTSRKKNDGLSIEITANDYAGNPLPVVSYVRTYKIFCLNESLIEKQVSTTTDSFIRQVNRSIYALLQ